MQTVRIQASSEALYILRWIRETCKDQDPSVPDHPKFKEYLGALRDNTIFRELLGALKDPFECLQNPV
jgi:hypothetical protein